MLPQWWLSPLLTARLVITPRPVACRGCHHHHCMPNLFVVPLHSSCEDACNSGRSCMCLVITIDEKGITVIDVGRLRSWIKDANILCQWNTSCVPTPEPATEPTALVSGGDIVVRQFIHCWAPFWNPAR
jgi:hypothetical protein